MRRILVVTAVDAERDSALAGLGPLGRPLDLGATDHPDPGTPGVDVLTGGVGIAAAATSTALALARFPGRYGLVASMGIGGGMPGRAGLGATVLGTVSIAADLGAQTADGFVPVTALGFGRNTFPGRPDLIITPGGREPAGPTDWITGAILTVSTVTGTADRATELAGQHPDAVAEAMEGFGVATAADATGTPFVEIRTVSNPVGPRDRAAWRIPDALAALSKAATRMSTLVG
jgi:futalosine hydrolase